MPKKAPAVRRPWERHRTLTLITGESMTHQSHAESCDINHIIRRFDNTGLLPDGRGSGEFADVTELQSKQTDELILKSRSTLDAAGEALEKSKKSKAQAEKERVAALEAENKRLKESATPSPNSSKAPGAKTDPADD